MKFIVYLIQESLLLGNFKIKENNGGLRFSQMANCKFVNIYSSTGADALGKNKNLGSFLQNSFKTLYLDTVVFNLLFDTFNSKY